MIDATSSRGLVVGVLLLLLVWLPAIAADERKPGVLILHSNQRPTPAGVLIEETLRKVIPERMHAKVDFFSEYLDDEWTSLRTYGAVEAEFLRRKYGDRNIRVIVASAPPALQFTAAFRDDMLPGVPVVHVAVPADVLERLRVPENVFGHQVDLDPTPTLELALRLHPGSRRLVFVLGAAERDRIWERRLRAAAARLGDSVKTQYLVGLPTAAVLEQVAASLPGTIVFTPGYFSDGSGEIVTPRESVERIVRAASVPVYGPLDTFVGAGIVGGYVSPYEDQATEAALMIVRLLRGISPAVSDGSAVTRVPMVDLRQVRRWGVDERLLPAGTVVRFREPTVWAKYRGEISAALAVILLQSVLIVALLLQRRRRRRAEEASLTLAGRLLTAHEDERRRLARDLHDDMTQRLARLAIDAGRMEQGAVAATTHAIARTLREDLVHLSKDIHGLSYRLHPSVLEDLGLAEGLRTECARLADQAKIHVDVDIHDVPTRLPRDSTLCVFRIAQEALRNVVRHADAKAVTLSLACRDSGLSLTVRDDGRGFDTSRPGANPSLGQISMRERVRLLGGSLDIAAAPGRGTTVVAWVPLKERAP